MCTWSVAMCTWSVAPSPSKHESNPPPPPTVKWQVMKMTSCEHGGAAPWRAAIGGYYPAEYTHHLSLEPNHLLKGVPMELISQFDEDRPRQ